MALSLTDRLRDARDTRSLSLFLALGINAFGAGMFFPFAFLYYQAATNLPVSVIGIAITAATCTTLAANPVAGILVDRFGARRIVVLALCIEAVGFGGYLAVSSALTLFMAALVATAGTRIFFASFSTLIAESVEDGDRDRWYGMVGVTQTVGASLSGLLATLMIGSIGLGGFRVIILTNIGCLLLAAVLIHHGQSIREQVSSGSEVVTCRAIWRDRPFLLLVGSNLLFVSSTMLMGIGFVIYATEVLEAPLWSLGVIGVVQTVLTVGLQTRVTWLMRGVRRTRSIAVASAIWVVATLAFAAGIFVPVAAIIPYLLLASLVFTAAQWFYGPASRALAAGLGPPAARGRYIATFELSWGVAAAITPAMFGLLYGWAPVAPWLAMAVLVLFAIGLVLLAEPHVSLADNVPLRDTSLRQKD